jgi:uncharacterized membrane protein
MAVAVGGSRVGAGVAVNGMNGVTVTVGGAGVSPTKKSPTPAGLARHITSPTNTNTHHQSLNRFNSLHSPPL